MSEPTKEALELAERIKERAMVPTGIVQFTRFDQTTAATLIDAHTASLREELRAAREALNKGWACRMCSHTECSANKLCYQKAKEVFGPLAADKIFAARAACKGGDAV